MSWELCVIGTALSDPQTIVEAEMLLPSDFISPNNVVWAEMLNLHNRGTLDMRALTEVLSHSPEAAQIASGIGSVEDYLGQALTYRGSAMKEYVDQVLGTSIRRSVRRSAALIAAEAQDNRRTATELLEYAEKAVLALRRNRINEGVTIGDIMGVFIPRIQAFRDGTFTPAWVPHTLAVRDIIEFAEHSDFWINAARPGEGKCLGRGTKVVLFDGSLRAVEDIRVGDYLMGPNSEPRRVLSTTHGRGMMYWVRQNRGMDYRVNENHILSLKRSKNEGSHVHGEVMNISIQDLLQSHRSLLSRWKGYKVAIDLPERKIALDPYFLGLWLGDRTATNSCVTSVDLEIIQYLAEYAESRGEILHSHKLAHRITPQVRNWDGKNSTSLQSALRSACVLDNKYIPNSYLKNSRRVRLALLAGLIDSDGSMAHNGIDITMQNLKLMQQIKYLADTLGFRTSPVYTRIVRCQTGAVRTAYRITIHGDFTDCPIRLPRKKPDISKKRVDWRMTGIRVEEDKVDDYYGFMLDEDGLFLLEDMTVTHNSSYMRYEFFYAALTHGMRPAIFNLENDPIEYARYMIALDTNIDSKKLKNPSVLTEEELDRVRSSAERLSRLPIKIITLGGPPVSEIVTTARRLIVDWKCDLIGVDYIQLVRNGIEKRVEDVSITTGQLRALALSANVPVMANSQLSRDIEKRNADQADPQLSDLRDSGSIEQDGTIVTFIRSAWNNPSEQEIVQFPENRGPDGHALPNLKVIPVKMHVKKNRNGETGVSEPIKWNKGTGNFQTLSRPR